MCCSGGGIRASAFCLGGLQRLGERPAGQRSWYDDVDFVTAVSGGSYMAASFAMVNHLPPAAGGFTDVPVYAPGSPEDNRLRAHTRYLVEDRHAAAVGILGIVYGLILNLLPILAGLFAGGTLLGWTLRATGVMVLNDRGTRWEPHDRQRVLLVAAVIMGLGLLTFTVDRWRGIYLGHPADGQRLQRLSLRLFGVAATLLVLFVAIPAVLGALSATDSGPIRSVPGSNIASGFVGTAAALVGLVRATLGRFKGKVQATTSPLTTNRVATLVGRATRLLAPWAGSVLAAGFLLGALTVWVNNATYRGPTAGGWALCGAALVGICLWQLCTDINRSSIHPYYKQRLASAFAVRRTADGTSAQPQSADEPIRFSDYARDTPTLVVCAAVNTDQAGVTPAGRGCAPFTFSPNWVGISSGSMFAGESESLQERGRRNASGPPQDGALPQLMMPTREYEDIAGVHLLDLPAMVAVSGAAVSPVMGRMTRAPLRLLLGLANIRLGLWLPNPIYLAEHALPVVEGSYSSWSRSAARRMARQWRQPGLKALLSEIVGGIRLDRRWIYVTDGGHYENLGLVEALRRGATEIVVLDASGDPPDSWSAFGEAMQTARTDLGVEILLDPSSMRAPQDSAGFAPTLAVAGKFRYPNGVLGTVYLCKLAMPAAVSWDVHAWGSTHPQFPHDSTAQQLYGDREFEAYRRLGDVAADMALRLMSASDDVVRLPEPPAAPGPVPASTAPQPDALQSVR